MESLGCCCFCCGEREGPLTPFLFLRPFTVPVFPYRAKRCFFRQVSNQDPAPISLDGFISHQIAAGLPSSVHMAICMVSSSATSWWDLVGATAGWHNLSWAWAMGTLWCHSSPAALRCGEMLMGLLVGLQKGVSCLVCGFGGMSLPLLKGCNARGLCVSGEWEDLFVQLNLAKCRGVCHNT